MWWIGTRTSNYVKMIWFHPNEAAYSLDTGDFFLLFIRWNSSSTFKLSFVGFVWMKFDDSIIFEAIKHRELNTTPVRQALLSEKLSGWLSFLRNKNVGKLMKIIKISKVQRERETIFSVFWDFHFTLTNFARSLI